jgi:hypothetical protein
MAFDTNTLTAKGVELLASATAAIPIILDGCDATTTYIDQASAIDVSARPASPLSTTTDVSVIGATANHVMARAHFQAGTNTGGEARTLYLFGYAQNDPTNVYVIYVCSSQDTFHLPEADDVVNNYEALFDMIYSAVEGSVTTASTSVFCTLAEFNILKERVVTTHKEGDLNEGETQLIRGAKAFIDGVVASILSVESDPSQPDSGNAAIEYNLSVGGNVNIGGDFLVSGHASVAGDVSFNSNISTGGTIAPNATNTGAVGTYDAQYKRGFIGGFSLVSNPAGNPEQTTAQLGFPNTETNNSDYIQFRKVTNTGTRYLETKCGTIRIDLSSRGLIDDDRLAVQIGSNVMLELAHGSSGPEFTFKRNVIFESNVYMTASNIYVRYAECGAIYASNPSTFDGLVTVGGLVGTQPTYNAGTSARSLMVGSIILASYANFTARKTGEAFEFTASASLFLYFAETSGGTISATNARLPYGKYVPLCDVSGVNGWALFQCIELY